MDGGLRPMPLEDTDLGWKEMFARMTKMHGDVRVGVLADSEEGSAIEHDSDITVAEIAIIHEFGARVRAPDGYMIDIPERSFVRRTFDENRERVEAIIKEGVGEIIVGNKNEVAVLEEVGQTVANEIKALLVGGSPIPPPLSGKTIQNRLKKGNESNHPLYDQGQLTNAITHKVGKEEK